MFKYLLCRELECGKRKRPWSKKALLGHPKGRIDWVQPSGQIFWVLCQKETAMEHQGEGRHRPLWTKTDAVGQEKHVGKKNKKDCVSNSSSNRSFHADSEWHGDKRGKKQLSCSGLYKLSLHPLSLTHPSAQQDHLPSLGGTNCEWFYSFAHIKNIWDRLFWVSFYAFALLLKPNSKEH